jgi:hypothetical protein
VWDLRHTEVAYESTARIVANISMADAVFVGRVLDQEPICERMTDDPRVDFCESHVRLAVEVVRELRGRVPSPTTSVIVTQVNNPLCVTYINGANPDVFIPGRMYLFICHFDASRNCLVAIQGRVYCVEGSCFVACQEGVRFAPGLRDSFTEIVEHATDRLSLRHLYATADLVLVCTEVTITNQRCSADVLRVVKGECSSATIEFSPCWVPDLITSTTGSPPGRTDPETVEVLILLARGADGYHLVEDSCGMYRVVQGAILTPRGCPLGIALRELTSADPDGSGN